MHLVYYNYVTTKRHELKQNILVSLKMQKWVWEQHDNIIYRLWVVHEQAAVPLERSLLSLHYPVTENIMNQIYTKWVVFSFQDVISWLYYKVLYHYEMEKINYYLVFIDVFISWIITVKPLYSKAFLIREISPYTCSCNLSPSHLVFLLRKCKCFSMLVCSVSSFNAYF